MVVKAACGGVEVRKSVSRESVAVEGVCSLVIVLFEKTRCRVAGDGQLRVVMRLGRASRGRCVTGLPLQYLCNVVAGRRNEREKGRH